MSGLRNKTVILRNMTVNGCGAVRAQFSAYLDGEMTGVAMQSMAKHMDGCGECAEEFAGWREMQQALAGMGPAKAPMGLQARLRAALGDEREAGRHLAWHERMWSRWQETLGPLAMRAAAGTVAAVVLMFSLSLFLVGTPMAVEANDERLGQPTAPAFLYSEVPPEPIAFGRELAVDSPVMVEAMVDDRGRVYDYTVVSGKMDARVERRVEANLLSSVFRPATVFGAPVASTVIMTFSAVSVRG